MGTQCVVFVVISLSSLTSVFASAPSNETQTFISSINNYADGTITCTKQNCEITCDTEYGCSYTTINAIESHTLTLTCTAKHSCEFINIQSAASLSTIITCQDNKSCFSGSFIVSNTRNVTLVCGGRHSCERSSLAANSSTNIMVHCDQDTSCDNSYIEATHAKLLQLNCISCKYSQVYCPLNGKCDIMCFNRTNLDWAGSCEKMFIYIKNDDSEINVTCADSTSCDFLTYYCDYPYNDPSICTGKCCDVHDDYLITCDPLEKDCIVNCTQESCSNNWIAGESATSLTVICNGEFSCHNASIWCPTEGGSCSIDCSGSHACIYTYVEIVAPESNSVELECNGPFSCFHIEFICRNWYTEDHALLTFNNATEAYECVPKTSDCCPEIMTNNFQTTDSVPISKKKQTEDWQIALYVLGSIVGGAIIFCCYGTIRQRYCLSKAKNEEIAMEAIQRVKSDEDLKGEDNEFVPNLSENIEFDVMYFEQWNSKQIVAWIISVDPLVFKQYEKTLITCFNEEKVDGECLNDVDTSDIKRWGIKEFKHIKMLLKNIKKLVHHKQGLGNTTPIPAEGTLMKRTSTLMQIEGDRKTTKVESAVRLEIKPGDDNNSINDNLKEEKKENVLDAMLSDVMKMPSIDPNKIEQIDKRNNTDSEQSDNMYEKQLEYNENPGSVDVEKPGNVNEIIADSDDSGDMYVN